MDWKAAAVDDIRNHEMRKMALRSLEERIAVLDARMKAGAVARLDGEGKRGGAGKAQETMVEQLAECERLKANREVTQRLVDLVERGLASLEEEQQMLLEFFYRTRRHDSAQKLAMQLNVDRATVYRMRDEALRRFTLGMYGMELM